jgi:uncharacterized protein (DUF2126 family)/transglutaminase-like putative cysteine protease
LTIRVALHHRTAYTFDRLVGLTPHEIRLRPAAHTRTPIASYSMRVTPAQHFLNLQQDPYGNYVARVVFPEKTKELEIVIDLVADMTVINPFDFFVEPYAEKFPFAYPPQLKVELAPYLELEPVGPLLQRWLQAFRTERFVAGRSTVDFLVQVNQHIQQQTRYLVRMEPGIQTPDETLQLASGSCRDSGWLLVQVLRQLGLAARFVSGYLVQLVADQKPLDGPAGPSRDFTDLHAWAEVYIPGAGWVGLDPTSGLMAGEGHIPLACTAFPSSAAAVIGGTDVCESTLAFDMTVTRIHEDPRVTKPYSPTQWTAIDELAAQVDTELRAGDVRLTQGGEPTFVSVDDMDGDEWNFTALSPEKWELAQALASRLQTRFAPGALMFHGQGKWYPGEPLPRWALSMYWRSDGVPVWRDLARIAAEDGKAQLADAERLCAAIAQHLGLDQQFVITAFEDPLVLLQLEGSLPPNVDPLSAPLKDYDERSRLTQLLGRGLQRPAGYVLPLKGEEQRERTNQRAASEWLTSRWPVRREQLYLLPGDSPLGYRLPISSLPERLPEDVEPEFDRDPFDARTALHDAHTLAEKIRHKRFKADAPKPKKVVRTALCVEPRRGCLHVFLPPLKRLEDFINLVAAVERAAEQVNVTIRLEGDPPPRDPRLQTISVTPDPGVIEVNIHPATSWSELSANTTALYEEARQVRLGTEKFMLDGRHSGTGGGNHVTLGGATPADSPFLRRPDLLRSLITYWQNHPALSYLFSGLFLGPTSQAPRVDEARDDHLYELEIAFQQIQAHTKTGEESKRLWLVDRLLRHLLVDMTGNTHRAEFSIDKLYSPDGPNGRLGLVEFRAFEMPPHPRMSLLQCLLLRALVARFWKSPYQAPLVSWGTALHDRWMLPHFVAQDMRDVARDLRDAGYAFDAAWFAPFVEFRFPRYGAVAYEGIQLELRQAIEPWHVLGEEVSRAGTSRYVDSSVERLQVKLAGMTGTRHVLACNGRLVPLQPTGTGGEFVAGVRYKAWSPPSALHPTIAVQSPLVFDIVDTWSERAIGGCTYHVVHPGGRSYETFPVNANEAEARRHARFWNHGHTPGELRLKPEPLNKNFPFTLDLRWMLD